MLIIQAEGESRSLPGQDRMPAGAMMLD